MNAHDERLQAWPHLGIIVHRETAPDGSLVLSLADGSYPTTFSRPLALRVAECAEASVGAPRRARLERVRFSRGYVVRVTLSTPTTPRARE